MKNEIYEFMALVCFMIAGFFYLASAIRSQDLLVITGTIIWLFACFLWLVPMVRRIKEKKVENNTH